MKTKKTDIHQQPTAPAHDHSAFEQTIAELQARLARALADYQNLEKRYERESSGVIKFANSTILEKLLDIRDHLGSAAAHLKDPSLAMILSMVDKLMESEDVKIIDAVGDFDPTSMECQETVPGEKDKVVTVVRPGYRLHDRLLRPARVTVGDGSVNKV